MKVIILLCNSTNIKASQTFLHCIYFRSIVLLVLAPALQSRSENILETHRQVIC